MTPKRKERRSALYIEQQGQGIIDEEPLKTIRFISRYIQVSVPTIRQIVHEDATQILRNGQTTYSSLVLLIL